MFIDIAMLVENQVEALGLRGGGRGFLRRGGGVRESYGGVEPWREKHRNWCSGVPESQYPSRAAAPGMLTLGVASCWAPAGYLAWKSQVHVNVRWEVLCNVPVPSAWDHHHC